jgi:predicted metalloenzyme YecM
MQKTSTEDVRKKADVAAKCSSVKREHQALLNPLLPSQGNKTPIFHLAEMANGFQLLPQVI